MAKYHASAKKVQASFDHGKPLDDTSTPNDAVETARAYVEARGLNPDLVMKYVSAEEAEIRSLIVDKVLANTLHQGRVGIIQIPKVLNAK